MVKYKYEVCFHMKSGNKYKTTQISEIPTKRRVEKYFLNLMDRAKCAYFYFETNENEAFSVSMNEVECFEIVYIGECVEEKEK